MTRHCPPKLFVLMTGPLRCPDTTSNLKKTLRCWAYGTCFYVGATIRHLPASELFDVGRGNRLLTHNVFVHITVTFVVSVLLAVLISVAHQRLADALPCGWENRTKRLRGCYSLLHEYGSEPGSSSNLTDSETCLHTRRLEGSLVWFHRAWSRSAPRRRGSLQTERRQPSPGSWSATYHQRRLPTSMQIVFYSMFNDFKLCCLIIT